jgi:hypothetical protein
MSLVIWLDLRYKGLNESAPHGGAEFSIPYQINPGVRKSPIWWGVILTDRYRERR